jgi:hypothetical protein
LTRVTASGTSPPTATAFESTISLSGGAAPKEKLAPDAGHRNDGRWHGVEMLGGKVELRFARWDAAGRAVYEARGLTSTVPIYATSFQLALKRVNQLVAYKALKAKSTLGLPGSTSPHATSVSAPSQKSVTIDLNDPSMRDGVVPKPWLAGKLGSYFLDPGAITEAKDRGNDVRILDLSGGRGEKDLHAFLILNNDAQGGGMYALVTASSNPPFKMPSNASDAFNKGYSDMQGRISSQQMVATVNDLSAAGAVFKPKNVSVGPRARSSAVKVKPAAVRPQNRPTTPTSRPTSFLRRKFGAITHISYVLDKVGWMFPGMHVNPKGGDSANCLNTAVALERQRAGKPATALAGHVPYEHDVYYFYGRLPISGTPQKLGPTRPFDMNSMLRYVQSLPHGARGLLLVSPMGAEFGHVMVIENMNGRAVIMDGQNGYVVNPKALSTGMSLSTGIFPIGTSPASLPDLPFIKYEFLRTDDVRNPGSALPKNVLQARVEVVDEYTNRVLLNVIDRNGAVSKQWIDQSRTPGALRSLATGENVYLVNDKSSTVRAPGMLVIKQSDGQKMLKRIDSRQ